jgi:hypothetical protein
MKFSDSRIFLLSACCSLLALTACNDVTTTGPSADAPMAKAAFTAAPASILLNTGFDDQLASCWNYRPNSGGYNNAGCGVFKNIGSNALTLAAYNIRRGTAGANSVMLNYVKNEDAAGANVSVSADTLNVRGYYWFDAGFDFGQGVKISRVSSFNSATQVNDIDIILQVRSQSGTNQCGTTNMRDIGIYYNGRPVGFDWGSASATMTFNRSQWYLIEYQVILNTPGLADGSVRLWVGGVQVASRTGLKLRGNGGSGVKLNTVKIGGWYSNGAGGNPCPNPAQASRIFMDDFVIARKYVGY